MPSIELFDKSQEPIGEFKRQFDFLSNMHEVSPNGIRNPDRFGPARVPTSEHLYASSKLEIIEDRIYILNAGTGLQAKKRADDLIERGQPIAYESDEDRIALMERAIATKFARGTRMASLLLSTSRRQLIEGNKWGDNFWGVSPPDSHEGQNHLGIILMKQRLIIAEAQPEDNRKRR